MSSRRLPPLASNDARVPRVAAAVFALVTVVTLARSLVHLFALMVVQCVGRLELTFSRPFYLAGTAPGAVGNWLMIPLAAGMLVLSLRCGDS